jgi:hemerythrin
MTLRLTSELTSGFEEIDGQHRILLQRMDAAAVAARADDVAATKDALTRLGDYLMAHFAAEESFMAASGYPERGRHKSAHDLFMQDFVQLTRELELTGLSVPAVQWISTRVPEWIKFHIQVNDIPLGRFLASKRFRPEAAPGLADKPRAS